jgi:hypothetical protein
MTRDQIDELMRENGIVVVGKAVYALVQLVIAIEREACAKFIEHDYVRQFERPWRDDLSAAIRARK